MSNWNGPPGITKDGAYHAPIRRPGRVRGFVNWILAQHALALLARLFRYRVISYHAGLYQLRIVGDLREKGHSET